MKVTQVISPKFEPVTLVLETRAEVDLLKALLGGMMGSYDHKFGGVNSYEMYRALKPVASETTPRVYIEKVE